MRLRLALTCRTSRLSKARLKLSPNQGSFCFKNSRIGFHCIITTTGGAGDSLFPQSSKVFCFTNALQQFTVPTSREEGGGGGGGDGVFLILQGTNQNIPYYVCDASNPWCGLEFSFSPKTGG